MKHITILAFAACCFTPSSALAQDCRPNKSGPDPITRQQVDIWWQVISSTGILKQALLDDDFSITATIGRYGLANAVNLELKKEIESLAKAAFESKYHAVKGNQFWCGLKDGPSLAFTATEVGNETHAGPFSGRIVTTLVLSARLTNAQLAAMKEVLIGKTIAAVRIRLAGDLQIDKTVSDNNGRNMQQKFGCFFQAMEKRGINISASTPPAIPTPPAADSAPAKSPAPPLTIDQVIKMVAAKVPDDVIITTIRASGTKFSLTPDDLIKLKSAGVSDDIIRAMSR